MENKKNLRRENPEYQEIKKHKLSWKASMRNLFMGLPNWKKYSSAISLRNVPTSINDRVAVQADIKRMLKARK